ncbi:MAG: endonuclease MutS2 [Terriglobales bacterium]
MTAASDPALAAGAAVPDCAAVLELVGAYLATELGRAELSRLRFHRDAGELSRLQRRLAEAQLWLERRGGFSFASLFDPGELLRRARLTGAALEAMELLAVRDFLDACAALRENLLAADERDAAASWPELGALAAVLPAPAELRRRLHATLLPTGELDDQASPELARLRRRRAQQRQEIEAAMAQQLRRLGGEGVLQEELVTIRNQRFVLPVRAEQRRRAPGVVHGASSSGQTLFLEPLETIELNNEHIRLLEEEAEEVRRILAELTALVAAEAESIRVGAEACGELELEQAKARFGAAYDAHPAQFGEALDLADARHPLLVATLRQQPGLAVVPLSLRLFQHRLLIVSGPNTGGKTVVLKTVGMAAWMAQCGLPVCAQRASLPIFAAIWADVGDVQSIERSLSTFSSHLLHIREILAVAGPDSLIVLDELGTATNAAEGAALAVEIAAWLLRCRAWTLITTHHDALKAWAAERPDTVINGSVAVDPVTLAPSYRFRMGVPGVSAGLDMAERLGLPPELVAGARSRLAQSEREAGEYLQRLQHALAQAEDQQAALNRREADVAGRERAIAAHDRTYVQKQIAALRAELDRRLASFSAAAEKKWQAAWQELEGEITAAQKRKLTLAATRLQREIAADFAAQVGAGLGAEAAPAAGPPPRPQPGQRVKLRSLTQVARVLRRLESDDAYEVEAGALRLRVPAGDIAAIVPDAAAPGHGVRAAAPVARELNLIGMRAEEAVERLDKFLDQAILAEAVQVRIVHGSGFGVLRKAVAEALRAHPQIASFSHPPQNQGGQGVTVAEFKD